MIVPFLIAWFATKLNCQYLKARLQEADRE
jgi:hypothetical protein